MAALVPGGRNFNWYRVDRPRPGVCVREPYGVIANFQRADARAQIRSELGQMVRSGQRRLRIGIFFAHGIDTGTVMDSTGGDLSPRNRRNLRGLLADIKAAGFVGIEVAFHPEGPNLPQEPATYEPRLLAENWRLIRRLRPIIRAARLPYRIDLTNEAIPGPREPVLLRYSQALWRRYVHAFGRDDTVGFSVIGDIAHVQRLREVYGRVAPRVFDVHFYDTGHGDEHTLFTDADRLMTRQRLRQPWIIGEAFYDDAIAARHLRAAIRDTTRRLLYLTQWPLTRGSACADVDVGAPTAFDAYAAAGFA